MSPSFFVVATCHPMAARLIEFLVSIRQKDTPVLHEASLTIVLVSIPPPVDDTEPGNRERDGPLGTGIAFVE